MFRRRRNDDLDDLDHDDGPLEEEEPAAQPTPPARPQGPWDVDDAPEDGLARLDLGSLRVPLRDGLELRVDIDQQTQAAVSVTLATASSVLQVMAFAAPKSAGIWDEVRSEIAASLHGSGGTAQEVGGPYGVELEALVPTDQPGQQAPARFVGVDGPRWFLRGMLQGRAAVERDADPKLLAAFGQVVVVRGGDAMAVRDGLPIVLPKEALEQAAAEAEKQGLQLPERGPEITETR
ncbi:MAG: DUF3710 domain-containing protein [Mycobacteriales bacterium]